MARNDRIFSHDSRGMNPVPLIACALVALVVGVLVGHFVWTSGTTSTSFAGQTTVAEADLDKVIASYTYEGQTATVTIREAIESQTSLESAKADDGNYTMPSA